jgi:hypothetical protein
VTSLGWTDALDLAFCQALAKLLCLMFRRRRVIACGVVAAEHVFYACEKKRVVLLLFGGIKNFSYP